MQPKRQNFQREGQRFQKFQERQSRERRTKEREPYAWKPPSINQALLNEVKNDNVILENLNLSCAGGKYNFKISSELVRPIFVAENQFRLICLRLKPNFDISYRVSGECQVSDEKCPLFGRSYRIKRPEHCEGDFIKFPSYSAFCLVNPTINGKKFPYGFLNKHANISDIKIKETDKTNLLSEVYKRIQNCKHGRGELSMGIPKPGEQMLHTVLSQKPIVEVYMIGHKNLEGEDIHYPSKINGIVEQYEAMENGRIDMYVREENSKEKYIVPLPSTAIVLINKLTETDKLRQLTLELLNKKHVVVINPKNNFIKDYCTDLGEEYYHEKKQDVQHITLTEIIPKRATITHDSEVEEIARKYR